MHIKQHETYAEMVQAYILAFMYQRGLMCCPMGHDLAIGTFGGVRQVRNQHRAHVCSWAPNGGRDKNVCGHSAR
eukprot:scaffold374_cov380-Prasinococcus_capsulatus_cf.AAC.12